MIANETTLHRRPNDTEINKNGHSRAFISEQSPYRIVSYRRPRNDKCKTFYNSNEKTNVLINVQKKMNEKQICNTAPNDNHWITGSRLGTGTYVRNVAESQPSPNLEQWFYSTTKERTVKIIWKRLICRYSVSTVFHVHCRNPQIYLLFSLFHSNVMLHIYIWLLKPRRKDMLI